MNTQIQPKPENPEKPKKSSPRPKILNLRFVVCLLALCGVLGVGVHFVHGFQVKRSAKGLLYQADRAKEAGDTVKEIDSLGRYLRMSPDDWDVMAHFAERIDDLAKEKNPFGAGRIRAFFYIDEVLRHQPERHDIRRRQVETALALRRFGEAIGHLDKLLARSEISNPKTETDQRERADLERLKGLAERGRGKYRNAVEAFEKSIQDAKDDFESYRLAAEVYHDWLEEPGYAYTKLDDMVKLSSKDKEIQARLARGVLLLRFAGKTQLSHEAEAKVAEDVREAQKLDPKNPDVFLLAAAFAQADSHVKNKSEAVRKILTEGIQSQLHDFRLYNELIRLEFAEDKLDAARALVEQGLKELPNNLDLLYALAEMHVLKGDQESLAEASENLKRLRSTNFDVSGRRNSAPRLDYLEARIRIRGGKWGEAGQMLQKLRPELTSRSQALEVPCLLLLAQCYEKIGNPEQALLAYRQVQKLDPLSIPAHYGAGSMLLALGSFDEAAAEFQHLLGLSKSPRGLHLQVARALIMLNMRLPLDKRDVRSIEEELDLAKKESPDSPEVPLLQAQTMLLRGGPQTGGAQQLIDQQRKEHPDRVEFWVALAQLAGRDGKAKEALDVLDQAEKEQPKLRDQVELHLARLNYLTMLPPMQTTEVPAEQEKEKAKREQLVADARRKVVEIEKTLPKLKEADRLRLLSGLADAYARLGIEKETERLWEEIATQEKNNLNIRLLLFDRALLDGSEDKIASRLAEIKRIEGPGGPYGNYAEAGRLVEGVIKEAQDKTKLSEASREKLDRARTYLQDAAKQRSRWSRIPALEAEIYQLEGPAPENVAKAIEKYQLAVDLGERRPAIIRQLMRLLFEAKRFPEANQVVHKFLNQETTLVLAGLGKLAAEALLTSQDPAARDVNHIEKLAEGTVRGSQSYRDYLWLGRIRWALGKHAEAQESLQLALKKAEDVPETWVTLVAFLVETNRKKEAEKLIQQARAKLPEGQRPLALAACYEALGELKQSEDYLKKALAAKPNDLVVLHGLANFYLHHERVKDAEVHLETIINSKEAKRDELLWARRNLAIVKAGDTTYKGFEKAKELLNLNLKDEKNSLADKHAMALLLATRMRERAKAISLFEELSRNGPLTASERFWFVNLYVREDRWDKAQEHMLVLLASPEGNNPAYLSYYAGQLLRRGSIDDAQAQLTLLEKTYWDSPLTKEIKARVRKAQGKHEEAMTAVRDYARCKGMDLGRGALLMEALGQPAGKDAKNPESKQVEALYRNEAEKMFRSYVADDPQQPQRLLTLAAFLSRQKAVTEALDCCAKAAAAKPTLAPESDWSQAVASIMVYVLRHGDAGRGPCQRVEQWLKKELEKAPGSLKLMLYLADLYDYQEDYSKAEDLYIRAMRDKGNDVLILNNLAWLLAFKEDSRANALKLINNAIDLVGPNAELLDTRSVIHLKMMHIQEAIADAQSATEQAPSASGYFHLAQALVVAKKFGDARRVLVDKAEDEWGLKEKDLHSYERKAYRQMRVDLELRKNR
jgi:tetratricopeptide (TPR) repeat protein